jgi:hypothetical protein
MSTLQLLDTGTINGAEVRFFRPPELPDFPWVSWPDLLAAAGVPRAYRRQFTADLRRDWRSDARTIETDRGPTMAVPHPMAQGLIMAMIDRGVIGRSVLAEYVQVGQMVMFDLLHALDVAETDGFLDAALARHGAK